MGLKRKFYDFLVNWKKQKHLECLLVNGARQIGKTYIIEKFGRENYESFIGHPFPDRSVDSRKQDMRVHFVWFMCYIRRLVISKM